MALFDVPGWTVPAAPVSQSLSRSFKKRKRNHHGNDVASGADLEKLLKHIPGSSRNGLTDGQKDDAEEKDSKKKNKNKNKQRKEIGADKKQSVSSTDISSSPSPTKKQRRKHEHSKETNPSPNPETSKLKLPPRSAVQRSTQLTTLQSNMKQSLDGARFRLINEHLYKSHSTEASQLMHEDPQVFDEYHNGFRRQVQSWPSNPVQGYIDKLSSYPEKTVIADLGCGDAALAKALIPRGMTVLSFDLISRSPFVVESDVCQKLPLPGSEVSESGGKPGVGEAHIVDVVVCALSLMGTNWPNCIREAWRVLKADGELKIAEVASRFTDVDQFVSLINSCGFRVNSMDNSNTHFTLFEFTKIPQKAKNDKQWKDIYNKSNLLKPCEYKRR